jgi:hypothetical protein
LENSERLHGAASKSYDLFLKTLGVDRTDDKAVKGMRAPGFFRKVPKEKVRNAVAYGVLDLLEQKERETVYVAKASRELMKKLGLPNKKAMDCYQAMRRCHSGSMSPFAYMFNELEPLSYRQSLVSRGLLEHVKNDADVRFRSGGAKSLLLRNDEMQTKGDGNIKPAAAGGKKRTKSPSK